MSTRLTWSNQDGSSEVKGNAGTDGIEQYEELSRFSLDSPVYGDDGSGVRLAPRSTIAPSTQVDW